MHKQPLLLMLICFILGIFFFESFLLDEKWIISLLIFSFLIVIFQFSNIRFFKKLKYYFLVLFFFSVGIFTHFLQNKQVKIPDINGKQMLVFRLQKKLNSNQKNRRYEIDAETEGGKNPFKMILTIPKSEQELDFRHYYQAEIYTNKVEKQSQDFGFDYQKYLARKGIFYQGYAANSYESVEKKSLSIAEKIRQKRLEVLQNIDHSAISGKAKEFTKGIILADRTEMDAETVQDFSKSGLVHLLAISGSHMAIIFWLVLALLKPIFPVKFRNFPVIISLILIWSFAIFIDYGSSVIRSCIMITAYYFYILLNRKPDLLHAIAIAGFAILVVDSNQLFDVGFQLSFVAVLGIFWLNQPILRYLPKPNTNFQRFLVNIPSVSLSAQIATLPLVIFYFHQYSLISIVANLVVIPFSEIIILFSLMMTVLLAFSFQFDWLNSLYDFFVTNLLSVIHYFGQLDAVFYREIPMYLVEVAILYFCFYYIRRILLEHHIRSCLRFVFFLLLFFSVRLFFNYQSSQNNEVIITKMFKNKVVITKQKNMVTFWVELTTDKGKLMKSVVEPYLTSRRISDYEIRKIPENSTAFVYQNKRYSLE